MSKNTHKSKSGRRTVSVSPASIKVVVPTNNNNNSQGKRKKRRNRTQRNQMPSLSRAPVVKPCTLTYLNALLDPWGSLVQDEMPCIPDIYDMPSLKIAARQRGTMTVGTNGLGYVAISPFHMVADAGFLAYTTSAFTGTAMTPVSDTNVTFVADNQVPWLYANTPSVRLVACGLRVRYTGTELNRGGIIIPCRAVSPHDNLSGSTTATILYRQDHSILECDRKWHGCVYQPGFPAAYEWTANSTAALTANANNCRMGVMVTGTAGNTFAFDVVRYFEVVQNDTNPGSPTYSPTGLSKSHSDLEGLGYVRDVLGELTASDMGQKALQLGYSYIKKSAATAMASMVGGPTSGAALGLLGWR